MSEVTVQNYYVAQWCKEAKIGRTFFYELPAELAPRQVTVGRRRLIIEDPRAWAERLAAATVKSEMSA